MRLFIGFLIILLSFGSVDICKAVQYEPPINIVFMIHVEPLPFPSAYEDRIAFLEWLQQQALSRPNGFKMTILMNGDFAERAYLEGDRPLFTELEANGHELGTHAHTIIQLGPELWQDMDPYTSRYGIPVYSQGVTELVWSCARQWVDSLTAQNRSVCAFTFLCSTEGQLMMNNNYLLSPGNRSEKCLDYLGHLMRHPFRPGNDDRLGHELEEDLSSPFLYIDHYAQIGNENAHGYNCTAAALSNSIDECYSEWLEAEMFQGDSLQYKVWTFGFLTHLWVDSPFYEAQIIELFDHIDSVYVNHITPRGNLIARYATCSEVHEEYVTWEACHPGESSFSYVHQYPEFPLINEVMIMPEISTNLWEWVEIHNPTDQWIDISGYKITDGIVDTDRYWEFPRESFLGPYEYLIATRDGSFFEDRYGFRPDFERWGGTGARFMDISNNFNFTDERDGCTLINTEETPIATNTAITDGLSWGDNYVAGFTLDAPPVNQSYGRDANSMDTGYASDWSLNGGLNAPTPGSRNSTAYFSPEVFVRIDPSDPPIQVPASGGNINFSIMLGNEYSSVQVVDIWLDVVLPNGILYTPLIVREDRSLAPEDSNTFNVAQSVPPGAPPGFYRYNIWIGDYPSDPVDLSYFYFEKLDVGVDGSNAWPQPLLGEMEFLPAVNRGDEELQFKPTVTVKPNPFNPVTVASFDLRDASFVNLTIYDISGRKVAELVDGWLASGFHEVTFDGSGLPSAVYIYRLTTGEYNSVDKIVLIK